ncbi:hypothetical protein QZQ97_14485 [Serratia sp. root2]|nr:hypothetical protein [Serratia sp. root2]
MTHFVVFIVVSRIFHGFLAFYRQKFPLLMFYYQELAFGNALFHHSSSQPFTHPSLAGFLWLLTLLNVEKCKNKRKNGALGRQAEHSSLKCAQFAKNWP